MERFLGTMALMLGPLGWDLRREGLGDFSYAGKSNILHKHTMFDVLQRTPVISLSLWIPETTLHY